MKQILEKVVHARLTKEEHAKIKSGADKKGMSLSSYVREVLLK